MDAFTYNAFLNVDFYWNKVIIIEEGFLKMSPCAFFNAANRIVAFIL